MRVDRHEGWSTSMIARRGFGPRRGGGTRRWFWFASVEGSMNQNAGTPRVEEEGKLVRSHGRRGVGDSQEEEGKTSRR